VFKVKNPHPKFERKGKDTTLPFNKELMKAAEGFTSKQNFSLVVADARARGTRKRFPKKERCVAIDAAVLALCSHYSVIEGRADASLTTMATECGLATEAESKKSGNLVSKTRLSIHRLTRALRSLASEFDLLTYKTEHCADLGCFFPTEIRFKPRFFEVIGIPMEAVEKAQAGRAEYLNKEAEQRGEPRRSIAELAQLAFRAARERFYRHYKQRKEQGEIRLQARRDAEKKRAEIVADVRRKLNQEIARREIFFTSLADVQAEIERRTVARMYQRGHTMRLALTPG
jgi:incFII family plasmid replication initiator RepA